MASLRDLIDPALIQTDVSASSFAEALQLSYAPFVLHGLIEETYIEEVKKAFQENGPYFVLSKGTALPHSDAFALVSKTAMGVTILKKPVFSGSAANDPVKILFPLCTVDAAAHIQSLSQLTEILSDTKRMKRILASHDPDEIFQFITSKGDSI